MLETTAETSAVAVLNISHSVEDLDTRLATSFSKELSNSVSTGSFVVCKVVKPALTGPKGDSTFDLTVVVTECVEVTNDKCLVLTLLLHCCFRPRPHLRDLQRVVRRLLWYEYQQ
jgi:hypothetical protein